MSIPTIQEIWARLDAFLPGAWMRTKDTRECQPFIEEYANLMGAGPDGGDIKWEAAQFGLWRSLGEKDFELASLFLAALGEGTDEFFNPSDLVDGGPVTQALFDFGDRPDVVIWLLQHGTSTEQRRFGGRTPLHIAAAFNYVQVIEVLLDHGADIEAGTVIDGDVTPLMEAARCGSEESCRLLCERGANKERHDKMLGRTAQEIASDAGKHGAAAIIGATSRVRPSSRRSRKRHHE